MSESKNYSNFQNINNYLDTLENDINEKNKKIFSLRKKIQKSKDNDLKIRYSHSEVLQSIERIKEFSEKSGNTDVLKYIDKSTVLDNQTILKNKPKKRKKQKKLKKSVKIGISLVAIATITTGVFLCKNQMKKNNNETHSTEQTKKSSSSKLKKNELDPYKDEKNGQWGYKDKDGKIKIEAQYEEAKDFKIEEKLNGQKLALVKKDGLYSYIDEKGNVIIKPEYSKSQDLTKIPGKVSLQKNPEDPKLYGYIGELGIMIKPEYEQAENFEENKDGELVALVTKDGKEIYINIKGKEVEEKDSENESLEIK